MARNQVQKYLNQLDIRKSEYLEKQRKEYKFSRFQKSLEILRRVSYSQIIPQEIISEIEMIFKLMPVHELYYVKKDEEEFSEYIERLNKLFIKVLDDYESTEIVTSKYWRIIIIFVYVIFFFHKSIEQRLGFYAIPTVLVFIVIFWIYENRWRFRDYFIDFFRLKLQ